MKTKNFLPVCVLFLFFTLPIFSAEQKGKEINLLPTSCDYAKIVVVKSSVVLSSSSFPSCIRIIIKSGGTLHWGDISVRPTVIIVKKGGKLQSKGDLYMVVNQGGTVELLDGDIKHFHAGSGSTKITSEVEIIAQTGSAAIELDNSIVKK